MPEIQAMVNLRAAYERGDIIEMEKILRFHANTMLDDPFISMSYCSLKIPPLSVLGILTQTFC